MFGIWNIWRGWLQTHIQTIISFVIVKVNFIKIEIYLSNIEFSEYNPYNTQWSIFHTFVCQQYPIDSKEDQLQIEHLSRLILEFCRERDRTNYEYLYNYESSDDDP